MFVKSNFHQRESLFIGLSEADQSRNDHFWFYIVFFLSKSRIQGKLDLIPHHLILVLKVKFSFPINDKNIIFGFDNAVNKPFDPKIMQKRNAINSRRQMGFSPNGFDFVARLLVAALNISNLTTIHQFSQQATVL